MGSLSDSINDEVATTAKDERRLERDESQDRQTIDSVSDRLRTVDDVLDHAEIDRNLWMVDRVQCSSYEGQIKEEYIGEDGQKHMRAVVTPLWAIRVTLKRIAPKWKTDAIEDLLGLLRELEPINIQPRKTTGETLAEISLPDAHFGKLAWEQEVGHDYDTDIAAKLFDQVVADAMQKAGRYEPSRFLFPIGSDFLQCDNWFGTTTSGTQVDHDGRKSRVFKIGFESLQRAIRTMLEIAPVDVIWVPGNHDEMTSYYLGHSIDQRFHDNPYVSVDIGESPRKYYEWGTCLFGNTHGKDEKVSDLVALMATENPEAWSRCTVREWHIAHLHTRKKWQTQDTDESQGVCVRVLSSISGTDSWHHKKGYVGNFRGGELFLWHQDEGMLGFHPVRAK